MADSERCLYKSDIKSFLEDDRDVVFSQLNKKYHGDTLTTSREAWAKEIDILQSALTPWKESDGYVIFEYDIPRLGKRIDVVLLLQGIVFCLEFKVGQSSKLECDIDQVLDYALDLKYFHRASKHAKIVPILVPTKYVGTPAEIQFSPHDDDRDDGIVKPFVVGEGGIQTAIREVLERFQEEPPIDGEFWEKSGYEPTPTIIEAARVLYENHSVEDITRHGAETGATIERILQVIQESKEKGQKSICFVTGVPGAGKTLVGLDVAVRQTYPDSGRIVEDEGAVYLSGNGPLVKVLTEALARDNYENCRIKGENKKKDDCRREVGKFIQAIHRYRDNMLAKVKNPIENGTLEIDPNKAVRVDAAGYGEVEHVAVFDEAQRSWTQKRLADYLKRGGTYGNKMKVANFPMSEASFLIWSLDQREDWATIVCLVGGGQEIHTGEGGISEWIRALNDVFPHWHIYISPHLVEPEYADGMVAELLKDNVNVHHDERLHLGVPLRSFKADGLSSFVRALLDLDEDAPLWYAKMNGEYPIVLTRSMEKAKKWLHEQARGSERTGVLISKESARYKPLGIHVLASDDDAVRWFLNDKTDTRSSNYLEDAATEIHVQGLELDYTCVLWDADMQYDNGKWRYFKFNRKVPTEWKEQDGKTEDKREQLKYMLNAYRVLLTRARSGMVICVPEGNDRKTKSGFLEDGTRRPEYYDGTFEYLKGLGLEVL